MTCSPFKATMIQYQVQFSATFLHTFELVMWLLSLHGKTSKSKIQVLTYVLGTNNGSQKKYSTVTSRKISCGQSAKAMSINRQANDVIKYTCKKRSCCACRDARGDGLAQSSFATQSYFQTPRFHNDEQLLSFFFRRLENPIDTATSAINLDAADFLTLPLLLKGC